jgi:uncharacterized protein YycO
LSKTKLFSKIQEKKTEQEEIIKEEDKERARKKRDPKSECKLPVKFFNKFRTGEEGCMRLQFSNQGMILAATITAENSKTVIRFYDVEAAEKGKLIY